MEARKNSIRIYDLVNFLTALFIFTVLYLHHSYYTVDYFKVSSPRGILGYFSVGGFIFLSGYKSTKTKLSDSFIKFWKNRILRIYPLYFTTLLFFALILCPSFSNNEFFNFNFLLHALGLQALFPDLFGKNYPSLYFIGLLFMYYLLFSIIKNRLNHVFNFFIISLAIFIFCLISNKVALRFGFNLFHIRFFLYFYFFIFGMIFSYYEKEIIRLFCRKKYFNRMLLLVSFFSTVAYLILSNQNIFINFYYEIILILFSVIPIYIFFLSSNIVFSNRISTILKKLARASFAVYLFHLPIWSTMNYVWHEDSFLHLLYIVIIGGVFVFVFSYFLQFAYDCTQKKILKKLVK